MSFCCPFPGWGCCRPLRPIPKPTPPTLLNNGLQVQLTGASGETITNGSNVLFNTIVTNLSPNLSYNATTGVFTVLKAGVYYIDWWVNTDGAEAETTVLFNIVTSTGTTIGASSPSPVVTLQLNGNALVYLPEGATFSLVNNSGATVNYATSAIQANLSVMKVNTL
jgi:hypothetical protein